MTSKDSQKSAAAKTIEKSASTSKTDSPVPQLKHRHSFEERYSSIINQQILETTINREVLQRQVEAFFPFSRSPSKERTADDSKTPVEVDKSRQKNMDRELKSLQKLETLDIADKGET